MGTSRKTTELQLQEAQTRLKTRVTALDSEGVDATGRKRDTLWRHLDARRRQLGKQLRRISETEALNQEVLDRRAAKLAGQTEASEAEAPPVKEKKKKEKVLPGPGNEPKAKKDSKSKDSKSKDSKKKK